jgi:PAS domain S-box-containing protein
LRQSEGRLADIIGSAIDGIITVDEQQRVMVLNAAAEKIFGYTASEMLDQPLDRFIPGRFRAAHAGDIPKFEPTHVPRRTMGDPGTIFGVRANGEEFPIEASISETSANGSNLFILILRDVTERKRAEQLQLENLRLEERSRQVEATSRLKSEFIANMSHELRTPLNGIIGFAEFLVDGKPGTLNPKQKEYLADILNSGKHLLELINNILDLAKVEAGKMELNLETFAVETAVGEVSAVVRGIANKKGIKLTSTVAPELGRLTLDPLKFKQVCYNLLSNAVKFTKPGGNVEIRAFPREDDCLELRVMDTGIGIKPEDLQRLFREFEQIGSGASLRYEGTGLGLALTRKIVELQGGTIGVESEVGQGSRFTVVLPLVTPEVNA